MSRRAFRSECPGPYVARWAFGRLFLQLCAGGDQVLVNSARRRHVVAAVGEMILMTLLMPHLSFNISRGS